MVLLETDLGRGSIPKRRGKVRDVYDLGDRVLLVATDRISAFDWVMPNGIPDKGRVLTGLSAYWFKQLGIPNHLISLEPGDSGLDLGAEERAALVGRTMLVWKARVVPFECVVRGYLSGSAWKEYRKAGTVCGQLLPPGLIESDRIEPIFTPATKAESGHDENVPFETMAQRGRQRECRVATIDEPGRLRMAADHAAACGLILADTKLEWGFDDESGDLLLVDEVFTPDSSRYWSRHALSARAGRSRRLTSSSCATGWKRPAGTRPSPPALPDDVVAKTRHVCRGV